MSQNGNESNELPISNGMTIAANTPYERELEFTIPRGKIARGKTPKIIKSLEGVELLQGDGNIKIGNLAEAMDVMFSRPDFITDLVPLVFGLMDSKGAISKKDQEWLDNLSDMEIFEAYVAAGMYITAGGNTEEVRGAAKK